MSPSPGDPILEAFTRLARQRPEATLVLARDGAITAARLEAMSRHAERALAALEIPPGAPVAVRGPNGAGFLAAFVAARRAGHPVVLLDHRAVGPEVERSTRRFGLRALLCAARGDGEPIEVARLAGPELDPPPPGTAVVKLTSGSSGEARGVATTAAALAHDDRSLRASMGISADDRLLALVPFAHSYGLSSLLVPALTVGLTLVVPDDRGPFGALAAARRHAVTVLPTVPAYLVALLRLDRSDVLPPSLRLVISAGAALTPSVAQRFRRRFGLPVHAFYGASECGGITYDREGTAAEQGAVGEPVDGVTLELEPVDDLPPEQGRRVVVRSAAVATGYWPAAEARLDAGRYRTGDLAVVTASGLALVGRLNRLIHVRGSKVSPLEVERVIAQLPAVDDVSVQGVVDPGSGDEIVRAVVASGNGVTADEVTRWCRQRLADFKIPRRVVVLRELPRTARGKLDRRRLEGLLAEASAADANDPGAS
jgi:long-chain acyl-CoA synthetase